MVNNFLSFEKCEKQGNSPAVAVIFIEQKTEAGGTYSRETQRVEPCEKFKRRVEMLRCDAVKSATLNSNSVALKVKDIGEKHRTLMLYFNCNTQLDAVADMMQFVLNSGLKVREYYANISVKGNEN